MGRLRGTEKPVRERGDGGGLDSISQVIKYELIREAMTFTNGIRFFYEFARYMLNVEESSGGVREMRRRRDRFSRKAVRISVPFFSRLTVDPPVAGGYGFPFMAYRDGETKLMFRIDKFIFIPRIHYYFLCWPVCDEESALNSRGIHDDGSIIGVLSSLQMVL